MNPTPPGGNYPGNPPQPGYQPYPQPAPNPYGHQRMQPQYGYTQVKPFSVKAIVAMVMGGVGFLMCPIGLVTGIVGGVLGYMGMRESKEPGATHRGYGLALAGLITSVFTFVASVGIAAFFAWAYMQAQELEKRNSTYLSTYDAENDLRVIAERLQLYAIENNRSLAPGGPIVRDGWSSGYDENSPRVQGKLKLTDLVGDYDLQLTVSEYTLEVTSSSAATVRHNGTGSKLIVTDAAGGTWRIDSGSSP